MNQKDHYLKKYKKLIPLMKDEIVVKIMTEFSNFRQICYLLFLINLDKQLFNR